MQEKLTLILLAIYVVIVATIGIRNRKSKGSEDYFLANRKLPSWLLSITFIASWWGGGSAINLADLAFKSGINSFWIYGVPVLISTALMFIFAKAIRNTSALSQPQMMEARYNRTSSLLLSIFILIFMIIAAAVQVIVLGNFFQGYFGFDYYVGGVIGVLAVLSYSYYGGFRGVVLTDLFQFVFFLVTGVVLLVVAYLKSGGFAAVEVAAQASGKVGYTDFFHNVTDNLAYVITFGTSWMIQANVWQRISAARTPSSARKMMVFSFIIFIPLYLMISYTGMFASVFYGDIPLGGIVPDMVKNIGHPIVSAVLFLGLCSAIMSSMDSMVNTASMTLTVDIWQKYWHPTANQREQLNVARYTTCLVAGIALFIGLEIRSVLTISWIGADFIATGVFVPLVLGFIWKRGTGKAAVASMIFGLLFSSYNLLVTLGVELPVAWEIASVKQAIVGMSSSLILFIVVSLVTKSDGEKAHDFINNAAIMRRAKLKLCMAES